MKQKYFVLEQSRLCDLNLEKLLQIFTEWATGLNETFYQENYRSAPKVEGFQKISFYSEWSGLLVVLCIIR